MKSKTPNFDMIHAGDFPETIPFVLLPSDVDGLDTLMAFDRATCETIPSFARRVSFCEVEFFGGHEKRVIVVTQISRNIRMRMELHVNRKFDLARPGFVVIPWGS
jgi:hypothetical protein